MSDALDVEALCHRYGPMVLRRCRRLLRDDDEALDACQDVFVRLLERRERLNDRYPSSLLYRMATNVCLNRIRDGGRRPAIHDEERLAAIAAEPDGALDARLLLDRLFGREPVTTRTMAVLHYVDGLTYEEVARETRLSVSGVRKRLRRLRQRMKGSPPGTNGFVGWAWSKSIVWHLIGADSRTAARSPDRLGRTDLAAQIRGPADAKIPVAATTSPNRPASPRGCARRPVPAG